MSRNINQSRSIEFSHTNYAYNFHININNRNAHKQLVADVIWLSTTRGDKQKGELYVYRDIYAYISTHYILVALEVAAIQGKPLADVQCQGVCTR